MAGSEAAGNEPVEQFGPTSGYWAGWFGVVGFAVLSVDVAAGAGSAAAVAVATVFAWASLVMWIGLIRPGVRAHPDHLVLRHSFRDVEIPWHLVDAIVVRQTLRVQAGDEVHQTAAISRSARTLLRGGPSSAGGSPVFGVAGMVDDLTPKPSRSGADAPPDQPSYVEQRLRELVAARADASRVRQSVRTRWAPVETASFALLSVVSVVLIIAAAV